MGEESLLERWCGGRRTRDSEPQRGSSTRISTAERGRIFSGRHFWLRGHTICGASLRWADEGVRPYVDCDGVLFVALSRRTLAFSDA
jgi:hypothetical protein